MAKNNSLWELFWLFLKLGITSFGGPAAHVALMEDEFVRRRQWLTREHFLNLVGLTNIIPGPNSTELAIHIGYLRCGWRGLWLAGICFILPAFFAVTIIAHFYVKFSTLPEVSHFLVGVKATVLAVVLQALGRFTKSMFKMETFQGFMVREFWSHALNLSALLIIGTCFIAHRLGVNEIPLFFFAGLFSFFFLRPKRSLHELGSIFLIFLKVGSVLFGSGYVLLSFLRTEFITQRGWITESQLLDAISVGQFTPGPVFTTASFIGYLLQGWTGATLATVGIFLPAFIFVIISISLQERLKNSEGFQNILHGVVAASIGLLASTLWTLGVETLLSPLSWALFLVGLVLLYKRTPSFVLILLGGLITLFV